MQIPQNKRRCLTLQLQSQESSPGDRELALAHYILDTTAASNASKNIY